MSPVRHGFVMFIGAIALGCGYAPARAETALIPEVARAGVSDGVGPFSATRVIAKVREGVSLSFAGGLKAALPPGAAEGEFANPSAGLMHNLVEARGGYIYEEILILFLCISHINFN